MYLMTAKSINALIKDSTLLLDADLDNLTTATIVIAPLIRGTSVIDLRIVCPPKNMEAYLSVLFATLDLSSVCAIKKDMYGRDNKNTFDLPNDCWQFGDVASSVIHNLSATTTVVQGNVHTEASNFSSRLPEQELFISVDRTVTAAGYQPSLSVYSHNDLIFTGDVGNLILYK